MLKAIRTDRNTDPVLLADMIWPPLSYFLLAFFYEISPASIPDFPVFGIKQQARKYFSGLFER
jgi:hypothetical protein